MYRRWLLLGTLMLAACGGGDDGAVRVLDPNVAPVVDGDWYLPSVGTTWQWQLSGVVNTGYAVEVYDIDLFDNADAVISGLQGMGRKVICYFSAGSFENWREDAGAFDEATLGEPLDGWEGERWLDVRHPSVHAVMKARLDRAVAKGCDGVEPDNMDGFTNDTGFTLTADDQKAFNRFIANEAHGRGLTVALKNDGGQAGELVDYYDASVNEQCHEFAECEELGVFVAGGKPIFNAEYPGDMQEAQQQQPDICAKALQAGTRTLILPLELDDSFRFSCD